ncbi:MAG: Smr/MutS family protein [Hyphomicrobiales bacterium]
MTKSRSKGNAPDTGSGIIDDFELWAQVAASVKPLKRRSDAGKPVKPSAAVKRPAVEPKHARAAAASPPPPARKTVRPANDPPRKAPELTGLDRRSAQRLARGKASIEARIDLHGMTQENARIALRNFLIRSRTEGVRLVLVITGKGRSPYSSHTLHGYQQVDIPEREGVLRRALPRWLDEYEFRTHISGYQPAHPRHGGGGAFYIRLRKAKR